MFGNTSFEDMLLLQIKYGKRNGAAFSDWIMKKRTLSIAALIISEVSAVDFYDLETAIYFHCVPDHYKWFIKTAVSQLRRIHGTGNSTISAQ